MNVLIVRRKIIVMLTVTIIVALVSSCTPPGEKDAENHQAERSLESKLGTKFTSIEPAHFKPPHIKRLNFVDNTPRKAVWGAIGRDDSDNLYFGASTYDDVSNNAYVYQYNTKTKAFVAQSNVIEQLQRAQLYQQDTSQRSIYSKLYLADDGYLYFTSMDSFSTPLGVSERTKNHSYFWRKKPDDINWEHILSTRESLVSVQTDGRFVYMLGYPNHVLFQYDTLSRRMKRVTVGSVSPHISYQFLVSPSGHIFVPKVQQLEDNTLATDLIEFNSNLDIVDIHPMRHYYEPNKYKSEGIVSYAHMKNRNIYFITGQGALYKVEEISHLKHKVTFTVFLDEYNHIGNYIPSLFTLDGDDFLVGLGNVPNKRNLNWFIHEISTGTTVTYDLASLPANVLLSGSATRDNSGNLYVGGVDKSNPDQQKALMLQLSYASATEP